MTLLRLATIAIVLAFLMSCHATALEERKMYIVYMGDFAGTSHLDIIQQVVDDRSPWSINIPSNCSWRWRKILNLRSSTRYLIQHIIGNGLKTHLWYDNWHPKGSLLLHCSRRVLYDSRIPEFAKVEFVVDGTNWSWPAARSDNLVEIQSEICGVIHPNPQEADAIIWIPSRNGSFSSHFTWYCIEESLDQNLVNGKTVLCDGYNFGEGALLAGAVGTVTQHNGSQDYADSFPLPAPDVSVEDGSSIFQYINSTSNSTATIFKSNEVNDTFARRVASFSSRGPNMITHDILKPDLTGPGVDIVAAWSPISPPSRVNGENRVVQYNIIYGTSMSCPHASAVAAYIKSFHPTWSPAAIKSALMTTAFPMSSELILTLNSHMAQAISTPSKL